jgi:hypothetical protein
MPKSPIVVLVKLKGSSESNKTIVVQKHQIEQMTLIKVASRNKGCSIKVKSEPINCLYEPLKTGLL